MEQKKKGGLDLDWDKLLPTNNASGREEEEPLQLVVVPDAKMSGLSETMAVDSDECENHHFEELQRLSDKELINTVGRLRHHVDNPVLKSIDGSKKLKASLNRHENELERRQPQRLQKDDGCKKFAAFDIPNCMDASDSCWERDPLSILPSQSKFAKCFFSKLDEKTEPRAVKAFENELSTLNRREMRPSGHFTSRGRQKRGLSSRETPFHSPRNLSGDIEKNRVSNRDKNGRCFSACSPCSADANVPRLLAKRLHPCQSRTPSLARHLNVDLDYLQDPDRQGSFPASFSAALISPKQLQGEHVVLVDEEELEAKGIATPENTIVERQNTNTIIYYPSRDDSEAVEISYSDMGCLPPRKFLSSTIMNFYIRYMQGLVVSTSDREACRCHFFNTYFYEKLKEAVMSKSMEETSFAKFRRWWKGVNIFEKAHVLLPIHENLHWSLVIICIPDKEDESGLILLHLDSLGLHSSKAIFSNIKRFLIEEWKIVKKDVLSDLPMADKVWETLPQRIDEKVMEVPQQANVYDCGLFVLTFIKKFIDEAPRRLRKKDFPKFGKHWFNPEEASSLRYKIKSLLEEIFEKRQENQNRDS